MLDLRYRLLPYIYSLAWQVTRHGSTIMRPLLMDFADDPNALQSPHQFMFGPAFLVAPVTEPNVTSIKVYLPASTNWFDFWTGESYCGGKNVETNSPVDRIPLFVRAGSIVPLGPFLQYTDEFPAAPIELRIYTGADAAFTF
jgi:alpha-D-xyloside xylohydrolase